MGNGVYLITAFWLMTPDQMIRFSVQKGGQLTLLVSFFLLRFHRHIPFQAVALRLGRGTERRFFADGVMLRRLSTNKVSQPTQ
jgi:hypothetical protein